MSNEQAESLEMAVGEEGVCRGGTGASSPDALRVHALTSPHPFTPNITVRVQKKKKKPPQDQISEANEDNVKKTASGYQ